MFGNIFYVIGLAAFLTVLILATLTARHMLGVIGRKAKIENVKMDTELDRLKHVRTVASFDQRDRLLQLTTGKEKEEEKAVAPAVEEPPEKVAVHKRNIVHQFFGSGPDPAVEEAEEGQWSPTT